MIIKELKEKLEQFDENMNIEFALMNINDYIDFMGIEDRSKIGEIIVNLKNIDNIEEEKVSKKFFKKEIINKICQSKIYMGDEIKEQIVNLMKSL